MPSPAIEAQPLRGTMRRTARRRTGSGARLTGPRFPFTDRPMARARAVANELIRRAKADGRSLTPLQIMKLVYIAHGWMLHLYHRPLITDGIEAWRYGPVIPDLYAAMKQYGGGSVADELPLDGNLDAEEKDLVDQVYAIYGSRTGMQLSALTHQIGTPWHQTWTQVGQNGPISDDLIAEHYRQLANERTEARS